MINIPWDTVKELVHFIGYVFLIKWGMEFFRFVIDTLFTRFCKHCNKKI